MIVWQSVKHRGPWSLLNRSMRQLLYIGLLFFSVQLSGQLGGLNTYDFLNLSPSARITALGGYATALSDGDLNMMYSNPALIDSQVTQQIVINHNFHLAEVTHGNAGYGLYLDKLRMAVGIGASYVSYGAFRRFDFRDNELGTFNANEYALNVAVSKSIRDRLHIGANVKFIRSSFDIYQSNAIGLDLGVHYNKPENRSAWSLVIRNIGLQLSSFGLAREGLPIDVQIGYTKRLEHLPFRFLVSAHDLNHWNLNRVDSDDLDPIFINQPEEGGGGGLAGFADNFFRHLVFGGELSIGRNDVVRLRVGYNHQRNKELSTAAFRSLSGFSFGFGIKVKKIRFDYGFGSYHLAGGVNHLSLVMQMSELFRKV